MAIKEFLSTYDAQIEMADGKHVGRVVVSRDSFGRRPAIDTKFAASLDSDERLRSTLAFCMNHNSPSFTKRPYEIERGASAYYTWNPLDRTVVVEWGEIDGEEAKLHNYLNQVLDPSARHANGMTVRSGHLTTVRQEGLVVCMLDSTYKGQEIVDTLNKNGFLVVDGLGNVQRTKNRGETNVS